MRNWENDRLIPYEQTPTAMIQAYAEKIDIFDHFGESMMTLLQGNKGLVEVTLASYTEARQRI